MNPFSVTVNGQRVAEYRGYIKHKGLHNYFISIDIKRNPAYCNSSITINAYSKSDQKIAIAVKYKWASIKQSSGKATQIICGSNHYQLSPRGTLIVIRYQ